MKGKDFCKENKKNLESRDFEEELYNLGFKIYRLEKALDNMRYYYGFVNGAIIMFFLLKSNKVSHIFIFIGVMLLAFVLSILINKHIIERKTNLEVERTRTEADFDVAKEMGLVKDTKEELGRIKKELDEEKNIIKGRMNIADS